MLKYCVALMGLFFATTVVAADYQYKVHKTDKQVIHVVTISPKHYDAALVKAQEGRETVASMATRKQAEIAINGGFFDMGGDRDGAPTGSLVINGKIYGIRNKTQALALVQAGQLAIRFTNPKQYLNKHIGEETSLVSGIPMLINEGKVLENLSNKKGTFYLKPHARTAIGMMPNGDIILCVVEHRYMKDLSSLSVGELQAFLQKKAVMLKEQYNKKQGELTLTELKKIFKEEDPEGIQGLSIIELANFLKKLGCEFAMNLDGGGSSTLWIDGKVMNSTLGDEDEAKGLAIVRPVSDALVFSKKRI